MPKKIIKKKKIKLIAVLIFAVVLTGFYYLIKISLDFKIQNIYIEGTRRLNDEYILTLAEIEDYPSFLKTFSWSIKKRLESSPYIAKATVKKEFLGVVSIEITETDVLFFREYDKKYVLTSKEEVSSLIYEISPIRVLNYIPDTIYETFVDKFLKIDVTVRDKVSEIKYDPSEYDDKRFLIYMIDGNYVYITLTKFDSFNYYNEIYANLDGKKGTLYLDSGNHFQEFK